MVSTQVSPTTKIDSSTSWIFISSEVTDDSDRWVRKQASSVLIYEGIIEEVSDCVRASDQ